jgi:hypothetical protein
MLTIACQFLVHNVDIANSLDEGWAHYTRKRIGIRDQQHSFLKP